jgi:hypothetical protein
MRVDVFLNVVYFRHYLFVAKPSPLGTPLNQKKVTACLPSTATYPYQAPSGRAARA